MDNFLINCDVVFIRRFKKNGKSLDVQGYPILTIESITYYSALLG